jgi:hypothetical protein
VNAGEHSRFDCPMMADLGRCDESFDFLLLSEAKTGRAVPCQGGRDENGDVRLHWIIDALEAGESREYLVQTACDDDPDCDCDCEDCEDEQCECDCGCDDEEDLDSEEEDEEEEELEGDYGVELYDDGEKVDIVIAGNLFSAYHYSSKWVRPFMWPVIGPYGDCVTRNYPMIPDVEGEKHDHHHQKSLYTAFGSVNGVDNWSEEPGHGRIIHRGFTQLEGGPVAGILQADNDWVGPDGTKVMSERRTVVVYDLSPSQDKIVDFTIAFKADAGEVRFGDTKEGGILSVRVATSMDVDTGLGGKIENSFGGTNENETWGKPAHWCDYSGPVLGRRVGVAIMDHPGNLRHPTGWHVRNYGLMTANCFAESYYKNSDKYDGSYVMPAGSELVFRYRLLIHKGDAKAGRVGERYHDYINPPSYEVLS